MLWAYLSRIYTFFYHPGVDKTVDEGLTLPLSLWVRSKIMAKINSIESALEDIQLALRHHLPDALKYKISGENFERFFPLSHNHSCCFFWSLVMIAQKIMNDAIVRIIYVLAINV